MVISKSKNVVFLKNKKGKLNKFELKSNMLKFGILGLKSLESGILNLKQIESIQQIIYKITKQKSKIWLKIFNFLPVYAKPIGIRMGKGKGKLVHYICKFSAGKVLLEICGFNKKLLIKSLLFCKFKLPIKTTICFKIFIWLFKIKNLSFSIFFIL